MNILFLVLFTTTLAFIQLKNFRDKHQISQCIIDISQKSLYNKPTILINNNKEEITIPIENDVAKSEPVLISNDLIKINEMVNNIANNNLPVLILNDLIRINETQDIYEGSILVIAFYANCKSVSDLVFDENVKYLLVIENCADLKILTRIALEYQTYHVTFILHDENGYIFYSIIRTVDERTCDFNKNTQLVKINSCVNGIMEKKEIKYIFPATVPTNLKSCPFNVGMATLFPYSIIPNKDNLTNLDTITEGYGSDIEIIKIVAHNLKASLNLYYIFREEENPFLHMEYVNYLLNGTLDVCAGGLYRIYGDVVSYSGIYTLQSVIWVYSVDRDIRSWQTLIQKINGLYYFLIFYITYTVIWNFVTKFDNNSISILETLLYGWGSLVGASGLQDARSMKQKVLNIVYLIMCLHLSAYISAQIYSYLTIQGPPQIYKTADELQTSDKKPFLQFSTKYFIQDKKYELFANTSGDCGNFRNCEETIMKYKGATIVLDGYLLPFQAETAVDDEARILRVRESILTVYHEMIMRKDSPLTFKFQDIVNRLFEAGICQKLYNEAIGITVVDKAEIANKNIMSNSYSCTVGCEITLDQLGGAFYTWIIGCFSSFIVFIIEVLYKRSFK